MNNKEMMLSWIIDTIWQATSIPCSLLAKLEALLAFLPPYKCFNITERWWSLLGILWSLIIDIPGFSGLFFRLQSTLKFSG